MYQKNAAKVHFSLIYRLFRLKNDPFSGLILVPYTKWAAVFDFWHPNRIGIHFSSCDMSILSPIHTILYINKVKNLTFWWFFAFLEKRWVVPYKNSYFHVFANLPFLFFCGESKESFLYFFIIINNEVDEICWNFELIREKMVKIGKNAQTLPTPKNDPICGKKVSAYSRWPWVF